QRRVSLSQASRADTSLLRTHVRSTTLSQLHQKENTMTKANVPESHASAGRFGPLGRFLSLAYGAISYIIFLFTLSSFSRFSTPSASLAVSRCQKPSTPFE